MQKLEIPTNLTRLAYDSIKQGILTGSLDENVRLTEDFLSNQLGISKSPVREALNRLEIEGLIRIEPRKGTFLRSLSIAEIIELYDLREAIEVHVMLTAHVTPDLIADLRLGLERMRSVIGENSMAGFAEEDLRFHKSLARATGNARLCEALENLQNLIWLVRRRTYDLASSYAPDFHEQILDALESGDREKARRLMGDHIRNVREHLVSFLGQQGRTALAG